jgi:hypothetical protein
VEKGGATAVEGREEEEEVTYLAHLSFAAAKAEKNGMTSFLPPLSDQN